jgi:hypothetical protein
MSQVMKIKTVKERDFVVDFLRGVAIIDMILVHFAGSLPLIIQKALVYNDVALEGFILLAGYSIGKYSYKRFLKDRKKTSLHLLKRAMWLIILQFVMIITIGFPHYIAISQSVEINDAFHFLSKSFFFFNKKSLFNFIIK